MAFEWDVVGAIALAVCILLWLMEVSKRVGGAESDFKSLSKLVNDSVKAMEDLKSHHDEDLKKVHEFFYTPSGRQKFVTFTDHDLVCERNSRATIQSVAMLTKAIEDNTTQSKELSNLFHELKVEVAVLKERRQHGLRGDESSEMGG
jgi:hypothetical protein